MPKDQVSTEDKATWKLTYSVFWSKYFESLGSIDNVSYSLLLQEVYVHDSLESTMKESSQPTLTGEDTTGSLFPLL